VSARVELKGFDELIAALTVAPVEIRAEGLQIVRRVTEGARQEIAAAYSQHTVTGTLAKRVTAEFPSTQILIGIVKSRAPHSHLFEFGTKQRRTATGANRGTMPAVDPAIFVPIARHWRAQMFDGLLAMMRAKGFVLHVTG